MKQTKTALCECGKVVEVENGKFIEHRFANTKGVRCHRSGTEPTFLESYKYSPDGTSSKTGRR